MFPTVPISLKKHSSHSLKHHFRSTFPLCKTPLHDLACDCMDWCLHSSGNFSFRLISLFILLCIWFWELSISFFQECMRGTLAEARVVYIPVEEIGGKGRLSRACRILSSWPLYYFSNLSSLSSTLPGFFVILEIY